MCTVINPGGGPSYRHTRVVVPPTVIPGWYVHNGDNPGGMFTTVITRVVVSFLLYPGGGILPVIPGWYMCTVVITRVVYVHRGDNPGGGPPSVLYLRVWSSFRVIPQGVIIPVSLLDRQFSPLSRQFYTFWQKVGETPVQARTELSTRPGISPE